MAWHYPGVVGKAEAARRVVAAAALGGGGVSVLGACLYAVLLFEAALARKAIGDIAGEPPDCTGWFGKGRPGPAIKVALLGDSSAAGYGVEDVLDTPGAHLASGLAEAADRRVYLRSVAFVGAQTRDLSRQIDRAMSIEPHVAVIMVGANDVTHGRRPSESVRLLQQAVRRLGDAGTEVVFHWGEEGGGSTKPTVEAHVQTEIRAIVSPAPYVETVRRDYAPGGWRTAHA